MQLCLSIDPKSATNDESDAYRHYVWSNLLSRNLGILSAEAILNAHENNPQEPNDEKSMDLANNRLGLLDFQKNRAKELTDAKMMSSFKEHLKNGNFIILKPIYSKTRGIP